MTFQGYLKNINNFFSITFNALRTLIFAWIKNLYFYIVFFSWLVTEMDVIKFRNNTMVCGCNTKIILIYGVIKLNFGVTLEYCIESLCNLL